MLPPAPAGMDGVRVHWLSGSPSGLEILQADGVGTHGMGHSPEVEGSWEMLFLVLRLGSGPMTWRPWEGLIEVVFVKYSLVSRVCFPSCVWSHQDRLLNDGELAVGLCLTGSFFLADPSWTAQSFWSYSMLFLAWYPTL